MPKSEADSEPKSAFDGLDYSAGERPSTGDIGRLALSLRELIGAPGPHCLAAAILIDQGRSVEALDRLNDGLEDAREARRQEEEAKKARRERWQ